MEESVTPRTASPFLWVVDPLDGTTNYAHGLPIFSASLGLEIDGEAVLGAVFDATRQELFVAERGAGATLNGEPIHVSSATGLGQSMLCTGFPYDIHQSRADVVGLLCLKQAPEGGESQIVSPRGEVLVSAGDRSEVLKVIDINIDEADNKNINSANNLLSDRVPSIYAPIAKRSVK